MLPGEVINFSLERHIYAREIKRGRLCKIKINNKNSMTKSTNVLRFGLASAGVVLALLFVVSATTHEAHAALVLDATSVSLLSQTLSATNNLVGTVQAKINAGAFTPTQSVAISATLGGIGQILANISAMIGSIGLPNTGEPPQF